MTKPTIGILHPGQMGISIAASAKNSGHQVFWASADRSPQTIARAEEHQLCDAGGLSALCQACDVILSVCPPHAAEDVAAQVAANDFSGLYVDANAISPQRTIRIGDIITTAGGAFVDGGIIGGPAWEPDRTWLYLSGERAEEVATCFAAGPLETSVIGETAGKASALKVCFAAYTKGTTALLCAIVAAAEALDVRTELFQQWSRSWPDFADQTADRVRRVTAKAWRFAGEMDEISATFIEAGLPGEFHAGSADVYRRLAHFKDAPETPALHEVLQALLS